MRGLGLRGCRVKGVGFQDFGFRVWGLGSGFLKLVCLQGIRVQDSGFWGLGSFSFVSGI